MIDANKGIQTQTAECLVVGELTTDKLVIALNKTDQFPEAERAQSIEKITKKLSGVFNATRFKGCAMVPVAARPGGGEEIVQGVEAQGIEDLVHQLVSMVPAQPRASEGPFQFAVDHCFPVKGQGTVLTGTVLSGSVEVGDEVELPALKQTRKVKSMQMFKRPVKRAVKGDRVGICVTQLDADLLERGIVAAPGTVPTFSGAIAQVEKIRFFKGTIESRSKLHLTVGHTTVMAEALFFGFEDAEAAVKSPASTVHLRTSPTVPPLDFSAQYLYQDQLFGPEGRPKPEALSLPSTSGAALGPEAGEHADPAAYRGPQWAYLHFDHPVTAPADSLVIGSRLDQDIHLNSCRLAFSGRLCSLVDPSKPQDLQRLQIFKPKRKEGVIERIEQEGRVAIGKNMFKKDADLSLYLGMKVVTENGEKGTFEASFGKSGKYKMLFLDGVSKTNTRVYLIFKKFLFDSDKRRMRQ